MTLVGTAEVLIVANTTGFRKELEEATNPAFQGLSKDAELAGADAGAGLRTGVKGEASKLEDDLAQIGNASGIRVREGVKAGASGLERDLGDAGLLGGVNLRHGVQEGTSKLAADAEHDGQRAGEGLHKGISSSLSKLAGVIESTGLPLGALSAGLDKAGEAAEHASSRSAGLSGALDKLGGVALAGVAAAGVVAAGVGVHLATAMQSADASIAATSGTSVQAATQIGDAFEGTAFKSEFSAETMGKAYATVAGQLKATQGAALTSAQAMHVMSAADDLATAKQIDLGTATSTLAGVMQAFQLKAGDAAHVSDVLFTASSATGQSVDALGTSLTRVRSRLGSTAGSVGDLAGLLVDMTERGITGRGAMMALNSGMNTLEKSATGVQSAVQTQNAAYQQMTPALRGLADQYLNGSITSAQFTKATDQLPASQAALAKSFATASTAVQTAQIKFREMGVAAFDARGQFVGMGSVIAQLHPRFAQMTEQQQLATAATLFGAGAARQMTAVIQAGPAAYQKATASVNQLGAAHDAAAKQSHTLRVEVETLVAGVEDLATRIGQVLIPILTALVGAFVSATKFVTEHKAVLIALAAVITGVLGTAIAVFTVNKMSAFASSFMKAGQTLGIFAAESRATAAEVQTGSEEMVASADAAKVGIDGALGATGVGLIVVALGVVVTELATHWHAALGAIESVTQTVINGVVIPALNGIIDVINLVISGLNDLISAFNATIGQITGSVAKIQSLSQIGNVNFTGGAGGGGTSAGSAAARHDLSQGGFLAGVQANLGALAAHQHHRQTAGMPNISMPHIPVLAHIPGVPGAGPGVGAPTVTAGGGMGAIPGIGAVGGAGAGAPSTAAGLAVTIAQEKAAADLQIARLQESVKGKGVSPERKMEVAAEIASIRASLMVQEAQQKAALASQTAAQKQAAAAQKAEAHKQSTDEKAGTSALNKMLVAIHSASLKSLQSALYQVHLAGLAHIERALDHDHSSALASLSRQLVRVHQQAMEDLAKRTAQAQAQTAQKNEIALLGRQDTDLADTAKRQADLIAGQTKLFLDQQAAQGKTGLAGVAAAAQVSLDQITLSNDQAIDAAQQKVDQVAHGSKLAQAQATHQLAQAQATADVTQAQAQSILDKANAAAQAGSTTNLTTNSPSFQMTFNNVQGAADVVQELGFALKVGNLPVGLPAGATAG